MFFIYLVKCSKVVSKTLLLVTDSLTVPLISSCVVHLLCGNFQDLGSQLPTHLPSDAAAFSADYWIKELAQGRNRSDSPSHILFVKDLAEAFAEQKPIFPLSGERQVSGIFTADLQGSRHLTRSVAKCGSRAPPAKLSLDRGLQKRQACKLCVVE